MRRIVAFSWLLIILCGAPACVKPGQHNSPPPAGFLEDYKLLKPSKIIQRAYLEDPSILSQYKSIRIPDFTNFTKKSIDPQAFQLVAEAIASELENMPPTEKPFQFIDRSPATSTAPVDLLLEGAITVYELQAGAQVLVAIECKLKDLKTGQVVGMLQHRTKHKIPEVTYQNPVREAVNELGLDVARFLAKPDFKK